MNPAGNNQYNAGGNWVNPNDGVCRWTPSFKQDFFGFWVFFGFGLVWFGFFCCCCFFGWGGAADDIASNVATYSLGNQESPARTNVARRARARARVHLCFFPSVFLLSSSSFLIFLLFFFLLLLLLLLSGRKIGRTPIGLFHF